MLSQLQAGVGAYGEGRKGFFISNIKKTNPNGLRTSSCLEEQLQEARLIWVRTKICSFLLIGPSL